ncbi:pyruvate dehydrogenase (acetyl-transferring) E1 component subunit alpha [Pseudactinotalea sp. HY160]|uniref:pyruvate dehydrogenase (acetyl-transferring) E1 component subunit alpha n=1 Tax=Pseudactinotalea sp. HY160 TaxID=2654490 RepID=UPI00128BD572|nr:pyruvate dehydrogenase (acetyl-transferring) E1 component subunit alpha [Pseudactinotalea sp. HY160]MPV50597.1 pyruvate dehydrogenase (acetyl-transferring) E1 component subunit alpha [Pseudactinotalea sp. HY160]
MVQLLTPTGTRRTDGDYADRVSHLGRTELETMYRDMALVRRFDAEATALQRHGELGLWPPSQGQEAAQVGSAHALSPQDFVFPSYREHGVARVRGLDLNTLLLLYRGQQHGGWDPFANNFATPSLVIGSHTLHATGYALGIQRDGDVGTGDPSRDRCVITYYGDGASSQGDVSEAMVFAASANAPVIFFCQNNQWAISVPTAVQSPGPIVDRGTGFGIPSIQVDGNDVLASYAVTAAAVERAHGGGGPTFIEAVTYRMGAHTTSDDPTRYRTAQEEESWRRLDPLERLRTHLEADGTGAEFFAELEQEADELGASARDFCRSLQSPAPESMFDHVYAGRHSLVEGERAWFHDYEAGFEEAE